MPATATVKKTVNTKDQDAISAMVLINDRPTISKPVKITIQAGPEPSQVVIEYPIDDKVIDVKTKNDDVALPPNHLSEHSWWQTRIGDKVAVYIKNEDKRKLIFLGRVVNKEHDINNDFGSLLVYDGRWLMSGVPIIGRWVYNYDNLAEEKKAIDEISGLRSLLENTQRNLKVAISNKQQLFREGTVSDSSIRAADDDLNDAMLAVNRAHVNFDNAVNDYKPVAYIEREPPVFNPNGQPNCFLHPTYGPIFTPYPNWNLGTVDHHGNSLALQTPNPGTTASFWTINQVLEYLTNAYVKGTNLSQYWSTHKVSMKIGNALHTFTQITDTKTGNYPILEGITCKNLQVPVTEYNVGDDLHMAEKIKNNQIDGDAICPEINLRGMSLLDALTRIIHAAGPYDLNIAYFEREQRDEEKEDNKNKGNLIKQARNTKPVLIKEESAYIVQTGYASTDSTGSIPLYAAVKDLDAERRVMAGIITQDGRSVHTSVWVDAAPIMLETRLVFLPADGDKFNQETGEITPGNGAAVDMSEVDGSTIRPVWTRMAMNWHSRNGNFNQYQPKGEQTNEEFEFLTFVDTGAPYKEQRAGSEKYRRTIQGWQQACSRWPQVFAAYKIADDYDYLAGTAYAGAFERSRLVPPPLPFLLTMMAETQENSRLRRFPYPITIEFLVELQEVYGSDATINVWEAGSQIDGLEVDEQGNLWLKSLRDAPLQGNRQYGTWQGAIDNPMYIRPNPFRITLAFPFDFRLVYQAMLGSSSVQKGGAGFLPDSILSADPLKQAQYIAAGLKRTYLADVDDAYRMYLRRDSFPRPQISGADKASDQYKSGKELLNEKEQAKKHAIRRLADMSRIKQNGAVIIDGLDFNNQPGDKITGITGTKTTVPLGAICYSIEYDYKQQTTEYRFR